MLSAFVFSAEVISPRLLLTHGRSHSQSQLQSNSDRVIRDSGRLHTTRNLKIYPAAAKKRVNTRTGAGDFRSQVSKRRPQSFMIAPNTNCTERHVGDLSCVRIVLSLPETFEFDPASALNLQHLTRLIFYLLYFCLLLLTPFNNSLPTPVTTGTRNNQYPKGSSDETSRASIFTQWI